MKTIKSLILAFLLAASLGGCSTLLGGGDRDRVPGDDKAAEAKATAEARRGVNIGNGYVLLEQVYSLAAHAVRTKVVTLEEGKRFLKLLDKAHETLDKARDAHFAGLGDGDTAAKGMDVADLIRNQVFNEVQDKIRKGGK